MAFAWAHRIGIGSSQICLRIVCKLARFGNCLHFANNVPIDVSQCKRENPGCQTKTAPTTRIANDVDRGAVPLRLTYLLKHVWHTLDNLTFTVFILRIADLGHSKSISIDCKQNNGDCADRIITIGLFAKQ